MGLAWQLCLRWVDGYADLATRPELLPECDWSRQFGHLRVAMLNWANTTKVINCPFACSPDGIGASIPGPGACPSQGGLGRYSRPPSIAKLRLGPAGPNGSFQPNATRAWPSLHLSELRDKTCIKSRMRMHNIALARHKSFQQR
jgi:hypothetical protein